MNKIVLLGGNGYIGTAIIKRWLLKDSEALFYSLSRSGKGPLTNPRVSYLKSDSTTYREIEELLPDKIDYIVDCVGIYDTNRDKLNQFNLLPAQLMLAIANHNSVKCLGYIGGSFGSKAFVESKAEVLHLLQASQQKIAYVEPSLVYGNGRKDGMTKLVPVLNIIGLFVKKWRPIEVNTLADNLIEKMVTA